MKKVLMWLFFLSFVTFAAGFAFGQEPPPSTVVPLAGSSPQLTAVDPYANAANSADGLKPYRPFWYSVDQKGLTILRIENNAVVAFVPWPASIPVVQPDGEFVTVPAPAAGWEPVSMLVTYPTDEALASNSETPPTYVHVVMAHSGYEWASNPNPPAGQDPGLRDMIVPSTNPATESSMLVSVDVSDPTFDPGGESGGFPSVSGAILGHGASQMAHDPGTDLLYVANMQSTSLPTNLQSFVSVITVLAPPVAEAAGAGPPAPEPPLVVMCGPEHVDEGLLVGEPYVWPCTESGDGPAVWEFANLPAWLKPHADKITSQLDGLLYGVPPANGSWTYQARVIDSGDPEFGPLASDWVTFTVNVIPTGVASEVEAGFEAGVPGGQGIGGTGDCTPTATSRPGSMVPNWVDVKPAVLNGVVTGCYVMGTAPISGEYYEFALPYFHFNAPFDTLPVVLSGNVVGSYMFDSLPAGVSLSGLAWHQIEKIHDPSTEADILNVELFGVEPFTGQLYRILPPQGSLEVSGAVGPPEVSVELDEITAEGQPLLTSLTTLRPDIAAHLGSGNVAFGNLVIEADGDIYVSAPWILDPIASTFIPIGGPTGSAIENGALLKISGGNVSNIDLAGVQAYYLGLNSNLAPGIRGVEPGQKDNGLLWVTGTNAGNVAVVDTAVGQVTETMPVAGAISLGGVSVDTEYGFAYVAGQSLGSVTIFGTGERSQRSPVIWSGIATQFNIGVPSSYTVMATGLPTPKLSYTGTLPSGVTFIDNGNGTATLAGTPPAGIDGDYIFSITAANGVMPNATQDFTLTIAGPPTFTSANTTTFTVGVPGSFAITNTGAASLLVVWCTDGADPAGPCTLPSWLVLNAPDSGGTTLDGTPPAGSEGTYTFTLWASTGVAPDASQVFTLVVNPGSGGGGNPAAPAITSASTTNFTVEQPASFQVTASGTPTPTLSMAGTLPNGVIFVDNRNGTAALAGMPAANTQGTYALTFTAANGVLPNATQNFSLVVNGRDTAPAITSFNATNFTVGSAGSFTVTTTGWPTPSLAYAGMLPGGVTFRDNGNGTATLSGVPADGSQGSYAFVITASNGVLPNATQNFNLTVNVPQVAPVITSLSSTSFKVGSAGSFTVTATGTPTPALSYWGTLPSGVTFKDNGNGTATLAGTSATAGSYLIAITASNGVSPNGTQNFTLTVTGVAPAITSGNTASFTVGSAGSFTVTATGSPTPQLIAQGALPSGVTFVDNGNGTATLAGTPASGTQGNYSFIITAANGVAPNATQIFTLIVGGEAQTLMVVTTSLPAVTARQSYSYQLQAQGGTQPYTWTLSGSLPNNLRMSSTGLISGTPRSAGTYTFTVFVIDSGGHAASQSLTLIVNPRT